MKRIVGVIDLDFPLSFAAILLYAHRPPWDAVAAELGLVGLLGAMAAVDTRRARRAQWDRQAPRRSAPGETGCTSPSDWGQPAPWNAGPRSSSSIRCTR